MSEVCTEACKGHTRYEIIQDDFFKSRLSSREKWDMRDRKCEMQDKKCEMQDKKRDVR